MPNRPICYNHASRPSDEPEVEKATPGDWLILFALVAFVYLVFGTAMYCVFCAAVDVWF